MIATAATLLPMIGSAPINAAPLLVGKVHGSFQPEDGKIFVLVIGNDARSGNPDNSRADAIHIAGINTKTMKGGILNFPRDSWVSIPGAGTSKMNEALYRGGPRTLAHTLENLTGIRIDYWVMVGFEGFRGIIDDIGGVEMKITQPVYDPTGSGAKTRPRQAMARPPQRPCVRPDPPLVRERRHRPNDQPGEVPAGDAEGAARRCRKGALAADGLDGDDEEVGQVRRQQRGVVPARRPYLAGQDRTTSGT